MNKSLKELGDTLRQIRESLGLTQMKVAEFLDIKDSGVSRIENGKTNVSYNQLLLLSDLFGKDITEILTYGTSPETCIKRKQQKSNRIMIELEIGEDEVIKMRLKDNVYQLA